jgi:hypothetical protein
LANIAFRLSLAQFSRAVFISNRSSWVQERCEAIDAMNRIEFSVEQYRPDWGGWRGVVPMVDGVSLITRIQNYEAAQGFDLPGSYGGLEPPDAARAADWVRYLLGEVYPEDNGPSNGTTWLLGCNCSVAGCWPLEARVTIEGDRVIWDRFRQPHRPAQDYAALGPFVFDRDRYEQALAGLASDLSIGSTQE